MVDAKYGGIQLGVAFEDQVKHDPDDTFDLEQTDSYTIGGSSRVSPATKRAVIVELAQGNPAKVVALRYDLSEAQVRSIWKKFEASTSDVRRLSDEAPTVFKSRIRRKAIDAIESGLDCDRDPYRQGTLGLAVAKSVIPEEFSNDSNGAGIRVNVLVNSVPASWKDRYISTLKVVSPQKQAQVTGIKE